MLQKSKVKSNILNETLNNLSDRFKEQITTITLERACTGLFFTGVKLSNGYGGICSTPVKNVI